MRKESKKGQIAVWVLLALVIVTSVVVLVVMRDKKGLEISFRDDMNPHAVIEQCTQNAVEDVVGVMLPQGGFVEPENYKMYNGSKVAYVCENVGYFEPCVQQHPALLSEIQEEIKRGITPRLEECFSTMKHEFERKGWGVELGSMDVNVSLAPGVVNIVILRQTTLLKNEVRKTIDVYDSVVNSRVYDVSSVAHLIADQEARYCSFEYVGWMLLHTEFVITKFTLSDATKVYTIHDTRSKEEMRIAVRGCAIPPGI